ncbi:DUF5067 domain-containing protein [Virgibacillus dokdonensis]|nr:DUF5067 domain-containing protein [Virgibacillus dokdonensis]
MLVVLSACGGSSESKNTENEESKDSADAANEESKDSEETNENEDVYFKNNEAKIEDLKIKIKETMVIPAGEEGNETGEKPVFAIWYETTNLTDKDIDPSTAWIAVFTALQDNDPNAVNELEMGAYQDGTVENSIAKDAKEGTLKIRFGLGFAKAHTFVTGQTPVMKYHRDLMMAILSGKAQIAKAVNATLISLNEAPAGYGAFNGGASKKFVIDPHGLVKA